MSAIVKRLTEMLEGHQGTLSEKALLFATEVHKGQYRRNKVTCNMCKGDGCLDNEDDECPKCRGKGFVHPEYIVHPKAVAENAVKVYDSIPIKVGFDRGVYVLKEALNFNKYEQEVEIIKAAGFLHDTVEDCEDVHPCTLREHFGERVEHIVYYLTTQHKETYSEYIQRLVTGPIESKIIKIADLTDNLVDVKGNVGKNKIEIYKLCKWILKQDIGVKS